MRRTVVLERARVRALDGPSPGGSRSGVCGLGRGNGRAAAPGPAATAIAVRDGAVLAIGTLGEVREAAGSAAERIDCGGATVLPGLLDPHLHLLALGARGAHFDCGEHGGVAALLAALRAHAARLPPRAWVRAEGLDETRLERLPTPAELDAAAGGRPVRLRHRSRHASLLGGEALGRLGGARGSARQAGGPTGLVCGREGEIARLLGPLPAALLADGLRALGVELAACGLTTVADATPRARRGLGPIRAAIAAGDLPQRVHVMRRPGTVAWAGEPRLRPGPVKLLVEEGPQGLRPSPPALARAVARAAACGAQVAVHCTGAATLVAALAAFAALPRAQRAGRRHRLEHLGECPPPLVACIAALGLAVVTNPAFVRHRGDVYREETPAVAWGWLYRARSLLAAGVPLAGASDAPVAPLSPWPAIAVARTRRTAGGAVLGPAERVSAAAALGLFTTGAAFALHADDLGRLAPGGPADLVVVEPDPLRAAPDEVADTRVRLTMIAGRIVWPA